MNQTEMAAAVKKMQTYVALSEQEISARNVECQLLQDELAMSRRLRESLEEKLREMEETLCRQQSLRRVSQFTLEKIESGGTIQVWMTTEEPISPANRQANACQGIGCCRIERLYLEDGGYEEIQTECKSVRLLPNVICLKTTGRRGMYSVRMPKCEPCPSPIRLKRGSEEVIVDPAQTVCDIWRRWTDMDYTYKKRKRRIAHRRRLKIKNAVNEAFGCNAIPEDSTLFRAIYGFMEGSQESWTENTWLVDEYVERLDNVEREGTTTRATKCVRKTLLSQMVGFMYNGEVAKELEKNVLRKKRFSTIKLARVSDMNSSFNPSALGAIASCEGGKGKGEVGLLCGETTLRRCMDQVFQLAQRLGFYHLPLEYAGAIWCWGDKTGILRTAVNRYVKTIYYDACCDSVTKEAPWIVPITGDGVATSQRGTYATVLGPKMADPRASCATTKNGQDDESVARYVHTCCWRIS